MLELLPDNEHAMQVVRRFGLASGIAEVAMMFALEREVASVPRVGRPLQTGASGTLWRTAQVASIAALLIGLASRRRPRLRIIAGALGTIGSLAVRFALMHAGRRSARDSRATFEQQRAGHGAAELARPAALCGSPGPNGRERRRKLGST
jgi:hypothetical protein